jgi:hypothetical protein
MSGLIGARIVGLIGPDGSKASWLAAMPITASINANAIAPPGLRVALKSPLASGTFATEI